MYRPPGRPRTVSTGSNNDKYMRSKSSPKTGHEEENQDQSESSNGDDDAPLTYPNNISIDRTFAAVYDVLDHTKTLFFD